MIRIIQPNKTGEVDGSSQIDKDCDCKITIHRPRVSNDADAKRQFELGATTESKESFSPRMLLTVGLSRYSSGGQCELQFDGATSSVRETDDAQRLLIAAMASQGVGHAAQLQAMGITPTTTTTEEDEAITI